MPSLRLRWSEHEAGKAYARPFMVTFADDAGEPLGSVALSGADLLYQRQFIVAVASLGGELFVLERVEEAPDPQRAWLDELSLLLPERLVTAIQPQSRFDAERGRAFGFAVDCAGVHKATVDAAALLEYQDFQAALAHQTGGLLRVAEVEALGDARPRQVAWTAWLRERVRRPGAEDAMASAWPWS